MFGAASAVALLCGASAASAATATFDFTTYGNTNDTLSTFNSNVPGFSVNVSGSHYSLSGSAFVAGGAVDVDTNSYGLISDNSNDRHTIDSWGTDEAMIFDFGSKVVKITNIIIGWYEGTGNYDLFVDGTLAGNTGAGSVVTSAAGSVFAIGARTFTQSYRCKQKIKGKWKWTDCTREIESGIKISSITVSYDDPPPPPVVPLPAGAVLMLTALGGLGFARKRKA